MGAQDLPKGFATSWRIMTDEAICDLLYKDPDKPNGPTLVLGTVRATFNNDWNLMALMGAKMVEMAANIKAQESRITKAPANALELLKGGRPPGA